LINFLIQTLITIAILAAFYGGFLLGRKKKESDKENLERFEAIKEIIDTQKLPYEDLKEFIENQFDQFKPKETENSKKRNFYE